MKLEFTLEKPMSPNQHPFSVKLTVWEAGQIKEIFQQDFDSNYSIAEASAVLLDEVFGHSFVHIEINSRADADEDEGIRSMEEE